MDVFFNQQSGFLCIISLITDLFLYSMFQNHRHLGTAFFFFIKINYLEWMFNFRTPWHVLLLF